MLSPVIKSITFGDGFEELAHGLDTFSANVTCLIGPKGEEGSEIFCFTVTTPKFLSGQLHSEKVIFGRHLLIVAEFDKDLIEMKIEKYLSSLASDSWEEIATKISRVASWEFEDYTL